MSFWCLHFSSKNQMKTSRQVVNLNLFVRFLEERLVWKNHFEFVWPLTSSYFALIESDDRPVNRECPICTHSIHYMSIGMRILVALIKTILCTIFELSPRPALKKKYKIHLWLPVDLYLISEKSIWKNQVQWSGI